MNKEESGRAVGSDIIWLRPYEVVNESILILSVVATSFPHQFAALGMKFPCKHK